MPVHYLEIVTADVETTVAAQSATLGLEFEGPIAALGNAYVASRPDGGKIGVRAPMHDAEVPTVRPYFLVDDIEQATADAERAGAMIAVPVMELPGYGKCSVYFLGNNQFGLWQL